MPGIRVIEGIKSQIARIRTRELQYIISSEQAEMDKYDKVIAKDLDDLHKMQDDYVKLLESPEEKQTYADLLEMWDRYMAEDAKIRAAARAGHPPRAQKRQRGEANNQGVALRGPLSVLRSLVISARIPRPDRGTLLRAWPLVIAGGVAYTAGALTTSARSATE